MKVITPHEPFEDLASADEALADARDSEARWQAFDTEQGHRRVLVDLSEPLYGTLERLARRQQQTVPVFIERIIQDLVVTFAASEGSGKS